MLVRFNVNEKGTDYVVGDIHGEKTKLMLHLEYIGFNFNVDRLFCCGDLIDRGPESLESLMLMYESWFFSVRGNHEQMMIESMADESTLGLWYMNGGTWSTEISHDDLAFYAKEANKLLPHQIQVGDVGIVHADVGSKWIELTGDNLASCLWDRSRFKINDIYGERVDGIRKMYVGHTPTEEKLTIGNVHYMDSGAVFGNDFRVEKI